jgi:hypothetical protein
MGARGRLNRAPALQITTYVAISNLGARRLVGGIGRERCERIDTRQIMHFGSVRGRNNGRIFGANQLMMLKMHMAGKGVDGKIRWTLFIHRK